MPNWPVKVLRGEVNCIATSPDGLVIIAGTNSRQDAGVPEAIGVCLSKRLRAMVACCAALVLAGCGADHENVVNLRIQRDFQKSNCSNRLSFYRLGSDGLIAGPKDANDNFSIPRGQSFVLTDVHLSVENPTTSVIEQRFSLYMDGNAGEVVLWSGAATAEPGKYGIYDRALTTGIRIAGPWPVCTAFSDQAHFPEIVLTGYLQ
jgi:hypothetical protein